MRVGDLVKFDAKAWIFERANEDYTNPGVILSMTKKVYFHNSPIDDCEPPRYTVEVLWADGRITKEHDSYVHLTEEVARDA